MGIKLFEVVTMSRVS